MEKIKGSKTEQNPTKRYSGYAPAASQGMPERANRYPLYEEEYVTLNGIEHYLLHYKAVEEAPVLLFIHGGPGQSESMMAYVVEEYASRNYNIVYYDQRGAGKTYLRNKKVRPDTEALKKDLLEIVCYVKKTYHKDKIGILGHSWGSVLGSMFAIEHPEHTLCYIGCGQMVNLIENESVGYRKLKEAIAQSGDQRDEKRLYQIGEYPCTVFDKKACRKMAKVRKLQGKYHLAMDFDKSMIKLFLHSPVTGVKDMFPFLTSMAVNMQVMKELMSFDLRSQGTEYQVPVYYVLGENDQQTPIEISMAYFHEIVAPDKKLYLIKNAGHVAMLDNVEDYRAVLCEIAGALEKRGQML
ncbi:MAG: alpha/beta hydrolase [Lachnospiraceae bacterium]|nr:alpha/beta hydrolase [Lachnospiraceae bacterium]